MKVQASCVWSVKTFRAFKWVITWFSAGRLRAERVHLVSEAGRYSAIAWTVRLIAIDCQQEARDSALAVRM
jgi:hypothetical protein